MTLEGVCRYTFWCEFRLLQRVGRYVSQRFMLVQYLGWTVLVLQFSVLQYTYHGKINLPWYFSIVQDRVCMYSFSTDFQVQQRVCRYRKIPNVSPINTYPPPFPNPAGFHFISWVRSTLFSKVPKAYIPTLCGTGTLPLKAYVPTP